MEDKPVVRNGEIVIRPIMNLSLTADHRVVDGSVAAEFLQRVKTLLENPAFILA
jgi:pyruvate dehydrogenase E2 component (dihydrolipoamide acetyltransferase)